MVCLLTPTAAARWMADRPRLRRSFPRLVSISGILYEVILPRNYVAGSNRRQGSSLYASDWAGGAGEQEATFVTRLKNNNSEVTESRSQGSRFLQNPSGLMIIENQGSPGFQTFVDHNIILVAYQSAALNFTLQPGEITPRVESVF
jgi:hypothetical protein